MHSCNSLLYPHPESKLNSLGRSEAKRCHNGVRLLFGIRLLDTIFIVGEMSYKLNWPISEYHRGDWYEGGCRTTVFAGQNNNNNNNDDSKKKCNISLIFLKGLRGIRLDLFICLTF